MALVRCRWQTTTTLRWLLPGIPTSSDRHGPSDGGADKATPSSPACAPRHESGRSHGAHQHTATHTRHIRHLDLVQTAEYRQVPHSLCFRKVEVVFLAQFEIAGSRRIHGSKFDLPRR